MTPPSSDALATSVYSGNGMGQHYINPEHLVVRRAVELVRQERAKRVLDLACGRGITAVALARETKAGHIAATDINESALLELTQMAAAEKLPIQTSRLDAGQARSLPSNLEGTFDVVVAKDLFPFLDPAGITQFLHNGYQALRPDGWFLLTAPSTRSQLFREARPTTTDLYRTLGPAAKQYVQTDLDHFTFTTVLDLAGQLKSAGMEMTEASHYGRAKGWIIAVAQKQK